ncbi:MAG: hypothetical protein ABSE93_09250 [Terriglobia bacterium]|jgi:hypothetical protein
MNMREFQNAVHRKLDAVSVRCAPGNVWAVMPEPYVPDLYDSLIEGHEPYARVFTHLIPSQDPKYVPSHPALPWEIGLTYDELVAAALPETTRGVSWIDSTLTFLPGHKGRDRLRRYLLEQALGRKSPKGIRKIAGGVGLGYCMVPFQGTEAGNSTLASASRVIIWDIDLF